MSDRMRVVVGILGIALAALWVFTPSVVYANDFGDCVQVPSQELCCSCAGEGPDPNNGSKFCKQQDEGAGGTDYCSDEVCPFDDEPCWGSAD